MSVCECVGMLSVLRVPVSVSECVGVVSVMSLRVSANVSVHMRVSECE